MVIALGEETDRGLETDPGAVTGLVQVVETDLAQEAVTDLVQAVVVTDPALEQDQARDRNQAQEAVAEIDPVPEQDLALARNRVQGQDQAQDKDQVRATRVPLVASGSSPFTD